VNRRRVLLSGLLVVTAFGLGGCKGATDAEKRLQEALRNTEKLSNTFLYKETVHDTVGSRETDVRGLVEDDFRYKARVALDGKPVLDEVVSDDALAVRFLDPAEMGRFLRKPAEAKSSGSGVGGGGSAPAPGRPPASRRRPRS
jgi:outer membrane lipoprotein-sorting protein